MKSLRHENVENLKVVKGSVGGDGDVDEGRTCHQFRGDCFFFFNTYLKEISHTHTRVSLLLIDGRIQISATYQRSRRGPYTKRTL